MALCRRAQEKVDVVDAASLVEPANLAPSTVLAVTAVRGAAMNRSGAAVVATPRAELRQLCAEAFLQQVQVRSTRAPPAAPPTPRPMTLLPGVHSANSSTFVSRSKVVSIAPPSERRRARRARR